MVNVLVSSILVLPIAQDDVIVPLTAVLRNLVKETAVALLCESDRRLRLPDPRSWQRLHSIRDGEQK